MRFVQVHHIGGTAQGVPDGADVARREVQRPQRPVRGHRGDPHAIVRKGPVRRAIARHHHLHGCAGIGHQTGGKVSDVPFHASAVGPEALGEVQDAHRRSASQHVAVDCQCLGPDPLE